MTPDCSITAGSPAEAVAVTPYVLGFHPSDSLVVLGLIGRTVDFAVRYDLPPPGFPDVYDEAAEIIARQGADRVVVLGYGPPGRVTPSALDLARALGAAGVSVANTVRVYEGRWWSYMSDGPADGTPCSPGLAAEAVYQGMVALPDRKSLVASVSPVEGEARREMTAATERARRRRAGLTDGDVPRAGRQAVREAERVARAARQLSADEFAWLGVLLVDSLVLDYAMERSGPDDWRIRLWTEVVRRVEPGFVPGPACLLGFAAWRAGEGALARVAVDRALTANVGHRMAAVLDRLLASGIRPHALVAMSSPAGRRRRAGRSRGRAGQSGTARAQSGTARAQSGTARAQSGTAREQSGTAREQGGTARGQTGAPGGQSGAVGGPSGAVGGPSGTVGAQSGRRPRNGADGRRVGKDGERRRRRRVRR
jgi:hypothetical protein